MRNVSPKRFGDSSEKAETEPLSCDDAGEKRKEKNPQAVAASKIIHTDTKGKRWVVHAEWAHKNERFETVRREKQS